MAGPNVSHDDHTLRIADIEIKLDYPVLETLIYGDLVIVVVEPSPQEDLRANVFAFNSNGRKVWTIEPATTAEVEGSVVYTGVGESSDGKLLAHTWSEETYIVNPENGSVIARRSRWSSEVDQEE